MASSCLCISALSLTQPLRRAKTSSFVRSEAVGGAGLQALGGKLSAKPANNARLEVSMPVQLLAMTGKKATSEYMVSLSNHGTKKLQGVNLQYKRLWWEEDKKFVKSRISTKALLAIEKKGLSFMAKEAGLDLNDFAV